MKNWNIGQRLGAGFGIVIVLLLLVTAIGYRGMNELDANMFGVQQELYPKIALVHELKDILNEQSRNARNLLIMTDATELASQESRVRKSIDQARSLLERVDHTFTLPSERALVARIMSARALYAGHLTSLLNLYGTDAGAARTLLTTQLRPSQLAYLGLLQDLIRLEADRMAGAAQEADADATAAHRELIGLALLAVGCAAVVARLVTRGITVPLAEAVGAAQRVAAGDLTSHADSARRDETGRLLQALGAMSRSLEGIVGQVRGGAESIATASAQIASGNMDLSARTEQQAGALEETASSMEELTATVKHNGDNARQADALAVAASQVAQRGGRVVGQVVETMSSISASSRRIVEIIATIDGIAFQTNILALNAAVEAARAGEQGRGFAVVAAEVRTLAQRSAAAAKEIKGLIDDSVAQVTAGEQLVGEAGATMDEVVGSVQRVTDMMREIGSASHEQESGIEQINAAVIEMDSTTQQNAALVEQAAAAAAALLAQAQGLTTLVSTFKLADPGGQVLPMRAARARHSASAAQAAPRLPTRRAAAG